MQLTQTDDEIRGILSRVRTIGLVGASSSPQRPSHQVMQFLQQHGYRVIPINPKLAGETLHGETVRASLLELGEPVDMVDIFRASEQVGPVVQDAIRNGAGVVWMQLGVVNHEAAAAAAKAGMTVVMDRCPKIEITRLRIPPP